jgi:hypothetical protein
VADLGVGMVTADCVAPLQDGKHVAMLSAYL